MSDAAEKGRFSMIFHCMPVWKWRREAKRSFFPRTCRLASGAGGVYKKPMSLKPLRIMTVGRPHASFWKDASAHYLERISRWRQVTDTVIRDSDPALPVARRVEDEGKRILAALSPQDIVVCLDEKGRSMTSREFFRFLEGMSNDATRRPCFIVGGPFGLHESVRRQARHLIAFGPQTLPHELARVVLLEQLYRAETLLRNMPYHHD